MGLVCTSTLTRSHYSWEWGPSKFVVRGPRPSNVARGIYSILSINYVIFSLGIHVSASLPTRSTGECHTIW